MANVLHLMNAGKLLSPTLEAEVREVTEAALVRHAARLGLDGVDVAMYVNPSWCPPELGVGGYTPTGHRLQITLDPGNPNFAAAWRRELGSILAHELHHTRRWRGQGYGSTLLQALVSEGLAQHFEAEERGEPPPYAHSSTNLDTLWERALAELDSFTYSHPAWFSGLKEAGLPRWAGYALGYELVCHFLVRQGGDAVSHADLPAEEFRGAWEA